jgi:type II secretory pathway component PulM
MVRLTKRERQFAVILAAFILVWAAYGLAIKPACERIATLERIIPEKQKELDTVQAQSRQYAALRREFAETQSRLARQDPNFELPSFLESVIEQHQLSARLANMQRNTLQSQAGYSQTAVEINFQNIRLGELVSFLRAIEESDAPATVGHLHICHSENHAGALDANVQVLSPQRGQNTVAANLPEKNERME